MDDDYVFDIYAESRALSDKIIERIEDALDTDGINKSSVEARILSEVDAITFGMAQRAITDLFTDAVCLTIKKLAQSVTKGDS